MTNSSCAGITCIYSAMHFQLEKMCRQSACLCTIRKKTEVDFCSYPELQPGLGSLHTFPLCSRILLMTQGCYKTSIATFELRNGIVMRESIVA